MIRRIAAGLALATLAAGLTAAAPPEVYIREPVVGQPALGAVLVVADVYSAAAVARVEFRLDGRPAGELMAPPYRLEVELGTDNVRHRIEVIAHDAVGNQGRAEVFTEAIPDTGRFGVSLQQLYVTATRGENRVLDLDSGDFAILDKGDRQNLVTFARGDIPFTAVLLIDASSSMAGDRLAAATAGVRAFVERAGELDRISMLAFSDRVLERTDFGNQVENFDHALGTIDARGGTAIHDHLYMAIKLLEQRQGRRVAVLLSDGIDSHSAVEMGYVLRKVRQSQALLYWIWLGQRRGAEFADGRLRTVYSTWHSSEEHRRQFEMLREAVADSGGRIVPVSKVEEIEPVFIDILAELREQYVLGYYPSNERDDGGWHRVNVKVRRLGVKVRTHEGYVDF
jgi:Ca-activated chloride channel family protein